MTQCRATPARALKTCGTSPGLKACPAALPHCHGEQREGEEGDRGSGEKRAGPRRESLQRLRGGREMSVKISDS